MTSPLLVLSFAVLAFALCATAQPAVAVDCRLRPGDNGPFEKTCKTKVRKNFADLSGTSCFQDLNPMARLDALLVELASDDPLSPANQSLLDNIQSESESFFLFGLGQVASTARASNQTSDNPVPDSVLAEIDAVASPAGSINKVDDLSAEAKELLGPFLDNFDPDVPLIGPVGLSAALREAFGDINQRVLVELAPGQRRRVVFDNCYRLDTDELARLINAALAARRKK